MAKSPDAPYACGVASNVSTSFVMTAAVLSLPCSPPMINTVGAEADRPGSIKASICAPLVERPTLHFSAGFGAWTKNASVRNALKYLTCSPLRRDMTLILSLPQPRGRTPRSCGDAHLRIDGELGSTHCP